MGSDQSHSLQLYLNRSRDASESLLRKVEKAGFDAIFLTVDAAVPGKRERDQRVKGDFSVRRFERLC
jgi:L-lactate dehydrogenase (cytochrome)